MHVIAFNLIISIMIIILTSRKIQDELMATSSTSENLNNFDNFSDYRIFTYVVL